MHRVSNYFCMKLSGLYGIILKHSRCLFVLLLVHLLRIMRSCWSHSNQFPHPCCPAKLLWLEAELHLTTA